MCKRVLKNFPFQSPARDQTPYFIIEGERKWEEAYNNWIVGRNPNSDPAWKHGVYMGRVQAYESA